MLIIVLLLGALEISRINTAPKIDGIIDSAWNEAAELSLDVQWNPEEGKPATESTKVYVCCDDNNVYVAFKCFDSEPDRLALKSRQRDDWEGDHVWVIFDTFGDRNTAYEFCVTATGVQTDLKISDDGRMLDDSWDGVWYSAAKVTDYGYDVEMKIPFKTMRFKEGFDEWGCNFFRTIYRKHEDVSWMLTKQSEGIRVSGCGILKGINPGKQGLNLEIYPVTLLRYESNPWDTALSPQVGLDVGWAFTSSQLSLTTYPDFAQIEADPYNINLSKYETYFPERRPFFIEKQEVFATPIQLFYSRRIGTKLYTGEEVPIIGGLKYTGSSGRTDFGVLTAYTGEAGDTTRREEPELYSVGRVKNGILENSEFGVIYAGAGSSQSAFGVDGTFRTRELRISSQVARATEGNAEYVKLDWETPKFIITGDFTNYDPGFCINKIGFAPWTGRSEYYLLAGPRLFNRGIFNILNAGLGGGQVKEVYDPGWGKWAMGYVNSNFKNNCGIYVDIYKGKSFEFEWFDYYQGNLRLWTDYSKTLILYDNAWLCTNGFNYRRMYFAQMGTNTATLCWAANSALNVAVDLSTVVEWNPAGDVEETSWITRPTMTYAVTKDMHLRVYAETSTDSNVRRFNALLSYNFRPKSWVYLAFNRTMYENNEVLSVGEQIAVFKVRYLFYL